MRIIRIILPLLLFSVSGAHAATITIDFNEVTPVKNYGSTFVESKGYSFQAVGAACGGPGDAGSGVSSGGIYFYTVVTEPFICTGSITMEQTGGGAFAIHSLNASGSFGPDVFAGTLSGGGAADLTTAVGTGDWLNLESFYYAKEVIVPFPYEYSVALDDIVVSAVPIPAAAWLFGSALGLLGWTRRKQAV